MGNVVPIRENEATPSLSLAATEDLARSKITPEQATRLGMFSVESARTLFAEFRDQAALVVPYFDVAGEVVQFERDGQRLPFCRVRYLGAPPQPMGFKGPKKPPRYGQLKRSGVRAYFPTTCDWAAVRDDASRILLLVEGEKKCAVAALLGFNAIGIGGCWNWRQDGSLSNLKQLLPELEPFIRAGRTVILALDGDAANNRSVAQAENLLAFELGTLRGADVRRARFPFNEAKERLGLDDYYVQYGEAALETLLSAAEKMCEADAQVAKLNEEYAVISTGGKTFVAHFGMDDTRGCQRIAFFGERDFRLRLANLFTTSPETGKRTPLPTVWLTHPHRREYLGGVAFAPLKDVAPDTLNLWRGFSVEPKAGDWSLLREHIRTNICSRNQVWFEYVMGWLARLVQVPGEPGQVAIVLRGKKGVGKGKFAYWIGRMMRDHFLQATQSEHVTGKFNSHLLNTILLFADEAFFAGDPRNEKILNGLITEEERISEQKYMPAITVPNYLHLVMATNSTWAIPATANERRYLVLDVSDAHMQDHTYFAAIDAQMDSGGLEAMLHDLQHRDISAFETRRVPRTAALEDQQMHTLHARGDVSGWVYECLCAGEIKGQRLDEIAHRWADGNPHISKAEARRIFDDWAAKRGCRPIDPRLFGREMRVLLGNALTEMRPRKTLGQRQDEGRRENYVFDSLEACRDAYRVALALPDLWSGDDA